MNTNQETTMTTKLTVTQIVAAVKSSYPRAMFIPGYGGGVWLRGVGQGNARPDWDAEGLFIDLLDANGYSV